MSTSKVQQSDKVALVTGAASGIGRATALGFAQSERLSEFIRSLRERLVGRLAEIREGAS